MNDEQLRTLRTVRLPVLARPVTNFAQCEGCGNCCKGMPGLYDPSDFGESLEKMEAAIRSGRAQADKWENERDALGEVYYLRPPTKKAKGEIIDYSYGGECALLGPTGCTLEYEERPRNCRGLTPEVEGCGEMSEERKLTKRDFVAQWKPFSDQLSDLVDKLYAEADEERPVGADGFLSSFLR